MTKQHIFVAETAYAVDTQAEINQACIALIEAGLDSAPIYHGGPDEPDSYADRVAKLLVTSIRPIVGMGVSLRLGSDVDAYTVVDVSGRDARRAIIQADRAIRLDDNGISECQDYRYEPDDSGEKLCIVRSVGGVWSVVHGPSYRVRLGARRKYHDFSF